MAEFAIISELVDGVTLEAYLRNAPSTRDKLLVALQVARALAWLHSREPPILHRDLHSRNVLIVQSDPPVAKVCDFGLAHLAGGLIQHRRIFKPIEPPELKDGPSAYTQGDSSLLYLFLH